ncbi:MAG: tol-pal system protein YbgF, partial [Nitrospinota bacterium]
IGKAASELGNKINSETGKVTDELEKRLNSEVSKVTDKLENINNQLRQNTNVVEATKTEYTGIKKTISEMDKVALETRAGQIEIKKTISNINGILEITKKNQADLKLEIDKLNEGFQQTASKIDEYVFRISNLNQRLDSIDVRLAQFSDIYKATAERGKKEGLAVKEISQKLNSMETGLVSLHSELSAIKGEIKTVNGKILEFIRNEGGKEKLVSENSHGDIKKGDAKIIPEQPGPAQGQVSVNQTHHVKELPPPTQESDPKESHLIVAMKPEDVFNTAYSDFLKGSFPLAITGFRGYIEKYPDTELAGKSQYWIGECYYSMGEFEKAILEFNEGINRYPKNVRVPSVMLKIADSKTKLNQISDASIQLKEIIKRYPSSDEAKQAEKRLLSIEKQ